MAEPEFYFWELNQNMNNFYIYRKKNKKYILRLREKYYIKNKINIYLVLTRIKKEDSPKKKKRYKERKDTE